MNKENQPTLNIEPEIFVLDETNITFRKKQKFNSVTFRKKSKKVFYAPSRPSYPKPEIVSPLINSRHN